MSITCKEFVQETVRVINESPEYIYKIGESGYCSYLKCNACVFGKVLSNLGFTQDELIKFERKGISHILDIYQNKFENQIPGNVMRWATTIQSLQDSQVYTWEDCLKDANNEFPDVVKIYCES